MSAQNFKDQDLTGQNFDGLDLSHSLFRGANLTNCSFVGTKLHGINMRETIIEGANFTDAEMFYCNQRDAAGTANWTGALVNGVPKWIPMPGSNDTSTPPVRPEDPLFNAVFQQTPGVEPKEYDYFTEADKVIINRWQVGDGDIGKLTGDYPNTEQGRELYETLGWGPALVDMAFLLNEAMLQNITFDQRTKLFFKPTE